MIDPETLRKIELLKNNLPLFAKTCLKIVTPEGELQPLIFNESQMQLHEFIEKQKRETGMVRVIVPKGRKQGVSTYAAARGFHHATFNSHKTIFILSHISSSTATLFSMVAKFYENLPPQLKLKLILDNSKALGFENGSRYTVGTAGAGEIGRGDTPQYLHASEMASYEDTDALETGIFQAVADVPGTEIIIESTAKGIGNMFHKYCMNALEKRDLYRLFFLPWYIHDRNTNNNVPDDFTLNQDEIDVQKQYNLTNGQMYWRRMKINQLSSPWKFKQEFPSTLQEAFQTSGNSFIDAQRVQAARKSKIKDPKMPLIVGVDPARQGDRTVVSYRRGREVEKIDTYNEMDEMQLASILARLMNEEENVGQVFIDVAHGYGTIDRLVELGFGRLVTGVHFSAKPSDPNIYGNKRAEMAFALRDWLAEDVSLPDEDDIEMDLLAIPDYKESSTGRILLEPKEKIKEKYGKSPDIFDSVMLTFAYPVRNPLLTKDKEQRYNGGKKRSQDRNSSPVMKGFDRRK